MSDSRTPEQIAALATALELHAYELTDGGTNASDLQRHLREAAALLRSAPPPGWREQMRAEIERELKNMCAVLHNLANVAEDESRHDTIPKYVAEARHAVVAGKALLSRLAAQPAEGYRVLKPTPTVTTLTEGQPAETPKDHPIIEQIVERAGRLRERVEAEITKRQSQPAPKDDRAFWRSTLDNIALVIDVDEMSDRQKLQHIEGIVGAAVRDAALSSPPKDSA